MECLKQINVFSKRAEKGGLWNCIMKKSVFFNIIMKYNLSLLLTSKVQISSITINKK